MFANVGCSCHTPSKWYAIPDAQERVNAFDDWLSDRTAAWELLMGDLAKRHISPLLFLGSYLSTDRELHNEQIRTIRRRLESGQDLFEIISPSYAAAIDVEQNVELIESMRELEHLECQLLAGLNNSYAIQGYVELHARTMNEFIRSGFFAVNQQRPKYNFGVRALDLRGDAQPDFMVYYCKEILWPSVGKLAGKRLHGVTTLKRAKLTYGDWMMWVSKQGKMSGGPAESIPVDGGIEGEVVDLRIK